VNPETHDLLSQNGYKHVININPDEAYRKGYVFIRFPWSGKGNLATLKIKSGDIAVKVNHHFEKNELSQDDLNEIINALKKGALNQIEDILKVLPKA
jgi:hypothetical protein